MLEKLRFFRYGLPVSILAAFLAVSFAQDESLEEMKYREDYERVQTIVKITSPEKRAEKLLALYADRKDMREELQVYADSYFARDLEALMKQNQDAVLKRLCERAIKIRPRFGEAYFFHGVVLKREKKTDEAIRAFARGSVLEGPYKARSKQQLDVTFRATGGSLSAQDKLVKEVTKDLKK